MPNATITSTENTFGTISGTFASDQSTITGTISGIITGTLDGSIGVPGPQGIQGPPGIQGPTGPAGEGVVAGGTTGQVLSKIDSTNYNTQWSDPILFTGGPITSAITFTDGSTVTGFESGAFYVNRTDGYSAALQLNSLSLSSDTQSIGIAAAGITFADTTFQSTAALPFTGGEVANPITMHDGSSDSEMSAEVFGVELTSDTAQNASLSYTGLNVQITGSALSVTATGITFPDASTQTVAFPGWDSVVLTGTPTAPTATLGDDSTQIATTAFVQDAVISGSAHAETLQATVRNNTGSTLASFTVVYISGAVGNKAAVAKAQANSEATSSGTFAVTESSIANNANGIVISAGVLSNVNTSAFTDGDKLYLSPTVAGGVTTTKPSAPNHLVYVGVVTRSHPTQGTVSVRIQNGYELNEIHDVAIASVADKDLLTYETSTTLWKNKSFGTLGLATLSGPTFTGVPAAPTASVSTNTTQLATTAFVVGQVGTATPLVNGTAAVGTSLLYARQDHVHGTDTTRAATANNLSDLASASTARTNLGLTSSTADIIAATSTSKVAALSQIKFLMASGRFRSFAYLTSSGVVGSGASVGAYGSGRDMVIGTTGVIARASYFSAAYGFTSGAQGSQADVLKINFSKACVICGTCDFGGVYNSTNYIGDANTTCRINFGGRSGAGVGDLTQKGFGLKKVGGASSTVFLTVHDGTTLTNVDSTVAVATSGSIQYVIYSDGSGNVTLFINGSQVATTSAGPTGTSTSGYNVYEEQAEATASSAVRQILQTTAQGLYIEY